jgi:hypothetical protein
MSTLTKFVYFSRTTDIPLVISNSGEGQRTEYVLGCDVARMGRSVATTDRVVWDANTILHLYHEVAPTLMPRSGAPLYLRLGDSWHTYTLVSARWPEEDRPTLGEVGELEPTTSVWDAIQPYLRPGQIKLVKVAAELSGQVAENVVIGCVNRFCALFEASLDVPRPSDNAF